MSHLSQTILLGPPGRTQAFPNLRLGLLNCWRGTERVKITRESNSSQDQPSVPHSKSSLYIYLTTKCIQHWGPL